jgi:XTP/dITP diphosphohydrolase
MFDETTLHYLTGNRFKFYVAQQALHDTGITLAQNHLATPEIQNNSVREIALYSAQWAATRFDQPFIVTDSGFYIDALNGFPGPFIKFVNQWFTVEDLLRLMHNKRFRHVTVHDCLVFSRPNQPLVSFLGQYQGRIATEPGRNSGTPIERLYIPAGYEMPISEFSEADRLAYWSNGEIWRAFKAHLTSSTQ